MRRLLLVAVASVLAIAWAGAAHAQETPPAAPSELTAGVPFPNPDVFLFWQDNANNETAYRIERSTDGENGPWVLVVQAPNECLASGPRACVYADRNLLPETTYWYRVAAVNGFGTSAYSKVASATVPLPPTPTPDMRMLPAAPSNLRVVSGRLVWDDNSDNEDGFLVRKSVGGKEMMLIAVTHTNDTTGPLLSFASDERCLGVGITVFAFNRDGESAPSETLGFATTDCEAFFVTATPTPVPTPGSSPRLASTGSGGAGGHGWPLGVLSIAAGGAALLAGGVLAVRRSRRRDLRSPGGS